MAARPRLDNGRGGQPGLGGKLAECRRMSIHRLGESVVGLSKRAPALDDLLRQPYQAGLVGERVADRSADAKAGVGLEVAEIGVVVVDCLEEAERSFLDQVVE